MNILIAGNPNSGKTTLFNKLTGLNYKVANYPGVTIEKKSAAIKIPEAGEVTLIDLPGIYSLTGMSIDEKIAVDALIGDSQQIDAIVLVVDSTNLERNLYLATELIDLKIPIVLALTMKDLNEVKGIKIYSEILSKDLDIPVVSVSANKNLGIEDLKDEISKILISKKISSKSYAWLDPESDYFKAMLEIQSECGEKSQLAWHGCRLISGTAISHNYSLNAKILLLQKQLISQGIDYSSYEATQRYKWINEVIHRSVKTSAQKTNSFGDKVANLTTHRFWGSIIFLLIMFGLFQSIYTFAGLPMEIIDQGIGTFGDIISSILPDGDLKSLIVDGMIAGVGNILIFVPQIGILILLLSLLEDTGYLARAAFLMDRLLRPFGLQGRSFVPLLSSFACAIPGILSTRTIASKSDRLATILIAPLMSCSARLPVYTVLIGACIPERKILGIMSLQGLVFLGMYLIGIISALLVSFLLKVTLLRGNPALFVMEMPPFRKPIIWNALREAFDRMIGFIKSAGSIILACSIILWALASYPKVSTSLKDSHSQINETQIHASYAAKIGNLMEPLIKPLGFNWEIGVSILASFAAREVFVSTLSTMYNIEDTSDESAQSLKDLLKKKITVGQFSLASGLSLMVFYVFACQCMSTLAVCKKETGSWGWTVFMFAYMTALAYFASWLVYNWALRYIAV